MRKLGIVFFAFLIVNCLQAKQVSEQDAKKAALVFYTARSNQYCSSCESSLQISESFVKNVGGIPLYFIFNINDKGYVIISADDEVIPILAYSFEGIFSERNQAPQFTAWLEQYARQISYAMKTNARPLPEAINAWSQLLFPGTTNIQKGTGDIEPMITSNWNQPFPYNGMCPADLAGSNGHAIAGCVPVAMGQIMYYYRWPDHGIGSYTYTDSTYGIQHVSFDSTWYRWNNMKDVITNTDTGIAQLLYHLGVSVDLKYGATSSGMYNHKAAYALRTYFKYSPATQYVFRDSTSINWDSIIIAHLERKMPLYYAGWSVPNIVGHAFVCDGYQGSDYFHFNFGWSGTDNGYFYLDNLTPGGNNFNDAQELIINIYPDTLHYTYPANCAGDLVLKYDQGSLTDGSGPMHNYAQGNTCSWLIDPQTSTDSISKITLSFDTFETTQGDLVNVYDGINTTSQLLGSFSGSMIPSAVSSTGNKMLVTFHSINSQPSAGWSANYSTTSPVWCSGTETITADTADVTDGSLRFNYNNNSTCKWKIEPANGKVPLTVYFRGFDTEPGKDVLTIYDLESLQTLAVISGHYASPNLPDSVTAPSGKMYLLFSTNGSVTGDGFHLYYPKSTLGLIEKSRSNPLVIFPNPVHDILTIEFKCSKSSPLAEFISSDGKVQLTEKFEAKEGVNKKSFDVSGLLPGVYILRIIAEDGLFTGKVVIN